DRGVAARTGLRFRASLRLDDVDDGQPVLDGEIVVALVAAGHGHDGPGAVRDQHVIGDPYGYGLARHRVGRVRAGEDAGLLLLGRHALDLGLPARLGDVSLHRVALLRGGYRLDQRVLWSQHHEGR